MSIHLRIATIALTLWAADLSAAILTVGISSPGAACTHGSLQAAIDTAAVTTGPDEIRIQQLAGGYLNQAVVVDNQSLSITGGFAVCDSATFPIAPVGRTILSGAGGPAAPVLWIKSTAGLPVNVQLDRLELVGGDYTNDSGGGLRVEALGQVTLSHSRIANNAAFDGAGIAVLELTSAAGVSLLIGDDVQVEDNQASGMGGGIIVRGGFLRMGGTNTVVRRNAASRGGGVATWIGFNTTGVTEIVSGGEGADGIISNNTASAVGGGVWAGQMGAVRLFTTDAAQPVRIDHNQAKFGGGLASENGGAIRAWGIIIDSNLSVSANGTGAGGAAMVIGPSLLSLQPALFSGAPLGAVACAANNPCNAIIGNRALLNGQPGFGAVLAISNNDTNALASVSLVATTVANNLGDSLFLGGPLTGGGPASISINNSRIGPNPDARKLLDTSWATQFGCNLCTITGTSSNVPPVGALFSTNGDLLLASSIIWEPGRDLIDTMPSLLLAADLLLHNASDFPAQTDIRVGDPQFVAPTLGDFHLAATSPALDSAPTTDVPELDLDGNPRVVDLVEIPNLGGSVDLGAYERPADVLFRSGFE